MFASCLLLVYILLVFSLCLFVACVMLVCCVILFVCCKPDTLRFFYFYKSLLEAKIFEKLVKKAETGSLLKFGKRLQQYLESLPGRSRGFPGFVHPVFFFLPEQPNSVIQVLYNCCGYVLVHISIPSSPHSFLYQSILTRIARSCLDGSCFHLFSLFM